MIGGIEKYISVMICIYMTNIPIAMSEAIIYGKLVVFENKFGLDDSDKKEIGRNLCIDYLHNKKEPPTLFFPKDFEEEVEGKFVAYNKAHRNLVVSKEYRIMRSIQWQQTEFKPNVDNAFIVRGGKALDLENISILLDSNCQTADSEVKIGQYQYPVNGVIEIVVNRFIHAFIDFQFSRIENGSLTNYLLRESRKIRGKDVHYFDHPHFGVLLQAVYQ